MITRVEPADFENAVTVQIESDAPDQFRAIEEIERWALEHGFVRTSEYHLRPALIGGVLRFRGICYRMSDEERAANEESHRQMIERGDALRRATTATSGAGRGH